MTWGQTSVSFVKCDDPNHPGNPNHRIEHGALISAVVALRESGWHYNARTQQHVCPTCIRIYARRN